MLCVHMALLDFSEGDGRWLSGGSLIALAAGYTGVWLLLVFLHQVRGESDESVSREDLAIGCHRLCPEARQLEGFLRESLISTLGDLVASFPAETLAMAPSVYRVSSRQTIGLKTLPKLSTGRPSSLVSPCV